MAKKIRAGEAFAEWSAVSSRIMDTIMTEEFKPIGEKTLRSWNQAEVAEILDVSSTHLTNLIKDGMIPSGTMLANSRRIFTFDEINKIRSVLCQMNPAKHDKFSYFRNKQLCQVIGVTNFKGGVGKSTETVTLAHDLCLRGYRGLIVDLDGQGSATTLCGFIPNEDIAPEKTIAPFLERYHAADRFNGFRPDDLSYCIMATHWETLDLIPANLAVSYSDIALATTDWSGGFKYWDQLREGLETIKHNYDFILIDFPPSLGFLSMNGIFACDSLLVPIPPDMLDFSSASAFFTQLTDVSDTLEAQTNEPLMFDFIKIIMTKSEGKIDDESKADLEKLLEGEGRLREAKKMLGYMMAAFKDGVLPHEIPFSIAIKEASRRYKSIFELEPAITRCSRKTITQCLANVKMAHDDIEDLIQQVFKSRVEELENQSGQFGSAVV